MSQRTWVFLALVLLLGTSLNFVPHTSSLPEFARRGPANGGNPFQPQIAAVDYRFDFAPNLLSPEQQSQVAEIAVYGYGSRGETLVNEVLPIEDGLPELQYRFTTRLSAIVVLFIGTQGQRWGRTSLVIPPPAPGGEPVRTFTSNSWAAPYRIN